MSSKKIYLNVGLPVDIAERLEVDAQKERRSRSSMIVWVLTQYYSEEGELKRIANAD